MANHVFVLFAVCFMIGTCLAADTYTLGNGRKNRQGRCPQLFDKILRVDCPSDCGGDSDCPSGQKCCDNDCGGVVCLPPTQETEETMCKIACTRHLAPVCGQDGVTYSNECMMRFTACSRNQNWIKPFVHDGECSMTDKGKSQKMQQGKLEEKTLMPCEDELNKIVNKGVMIGTFVPTCLKSGFYAPRQCWGSTGMCWCADQFGNKLSEPTRGLLEDCEAMAKTYP